MIGFKFTYDLLLLLAGQTHIGYGLIIHLQTWDALYHFPTSDGVLTVAVYIFDGRRLICC